MSDEDEVQRTCRTVKNEMIIDEQETEDIEALVLGYLINLGEARKGAPSGDLRKTLNEEYQETEMFEIRALEEIRRWRKLYPNLLAAMDAASGNTQDDQGLNFEDWMETDKNAWRKGY